MSDENNLLHNRGFAAMEDERQREIARKGGKAAHERGTAHEFSADEARAAGRKGGESVSKNREHMASIGRKGGESVSKNREHMAAIGRKGGESVSKNREHMASIGRKGGESRTDENGPTVNRTETLETSDRANLENSNSNNTGNGNDRGQY